MRHEFSLAYLTVPGLAPPEMVAVAARAGYDYVGLRLQPVTPDEPTHPLHRDRTLLRRTKEQLAATGLGVLDVELLRLTPEVEIAAFEPILDVSAELGARHVITQGADPDLARVTDRFAQLCEAAGKRGLTMDIEFVTWTQTRDLDRAARIIRGARSDNGGMLIDTLHFSRSGCSIAELASLPPSWFRYAQVCDAPRRAPTSDDGLIFAARCERLFLGEGGLDLNGILLALPPGIPYSIEIPRISMCNELGPEEYARRALVTAKDFVTRLLPARLHSVSVL